ncbi:MULTISPECIES: MinD/ParA family ATP-binding protein [Methylotenera]|uniref:MinD/ParA family ATP-binding protein n=1 Tax=Methylotenera TaxID=359407 RepID=UPI0003805322|nr:MULTISPECIES: hypothetical protein [Methylotenera]
MASLHLDQAAGLRRIMVRAQPRIISILSALGNTAGSANELHRILGNLAASFKLDGGKAHIIYGADDDIDTLKYYGLLNKPCLIDVMRAQKPLKEAISTLRSDFTSSWLGHTGKMNPELGPQLSEYITLLAKSHDIVMVETKVNANQSLPLQLLNDGVIIIQMNQKSASIKQAYSLIKQLHSTLGKRDFGILVHGNTAKNSDIVFNNIAAVAMRFLGIELEYMGYVPTDEHMNQAYKMGRSVVDAFPTTVIAKTYRELSKRLLRQDPPFTTFDTNTMI